MIKVGLTGNIGSGKTVVSQVFSKLGIAVYYADEESKKFLSDPVVRNEVVKNFGYGILANNNEINRRSLASVVFTDPASLKILQSILHPRVREDFRNWVSGLTNQSYAIQEAAIIFESGFRSEFDYIIHVSCPKETAINRVMKRDSIDGHSVLRRMQNQMEDEEKCRLSNYIIVNDGYQMIIPQILQIHHQLLQIGS